MSVLIGVKCRSFCLRIPLLYQEGVWVRLLHRLDSTFRPGESGVGTRHGSVVNGDQDVGLTRHWFCFHHRPQREPVPETDHPSSGRKTGPIE